MYKYCQVFVVVLVLFVLYLYFFSLSGLCCCAFKKLGLLQKEESPVRIKLDKDQIGLGILIRVQMSLGFLESFSFEDGRGDRQEPG